MRFPSAVAGLLGLLVLAACGGLPSEGPIRSGASRSPGEQVEAAVDYTPDGPRPGASPLDVVGGFLQAMQATPLSTAVAREFLTDEASTEWVPEKSTLVYGVYALQARTRGARAVRLGLTDTDKLGSRGQWLIERRVAGPGMERTADEVRYRLSLVRERGQWRIADPPDALIVAKRYFETRFAQHFLHYFDSSAQILVPEPVYVPVGEQAPTLLVRGLLGGPAARLAGATRTFIPAETRLDDLAVLVSEDGEAQVPLSADFAELDAERLDLALAQIGVTLGQVPGVESFQVTVDGSPLDLPGEGTNHRVSDWPEYDPWVVWASQELFALRDSRVVTISDGASRRVTGPAGTRDFDVRAIALDLAAEEVAGISRDGRTALVVARDLAGVAATQAEPEPVRSGASDLLDPEWDIYGQLWLLDRAPGGAELSVGSGRVRKVEAPGISGRDVERFTLSRDGTRLVAVLAGEGGDRLVISRVKRGEGGAVRGLSRARDLPVGALGVTSIRDVGWRSPGSLFVLTEPSAGLAQLHVTLVDGSSKPGDVGSEAEILRREAVRLVSAPTPGLPVYVETRRHRLYQLSENGRWIPTATERGLTSPTYVG